MRIKKATNRSTCPLPSISLFSFICIWMCSILMEINNYEQWYNTHSVYNTKVRSSIMLTMKFQIFIWIIVLNLYLKNAREDMFSRLIGELCYHYHHTHRFVRHIPWDKAFRQICHKVYFAIIVCYKLLIIIKYAHKLNRKIFCDNFCIIQFSVHINLLY